MFKSRFSGGWKPDTHVQTPGKNNTTGKTIKVSGSKTTGAAKSPETSGCTFSDY